MASTAVATDGVGGDHHHLDAQLPLFELDDELHAVHAGHLQIGDDAIEAFSIQIPGAPRPRWSSRRPGGRRRSTSAIDSRAWR